jgi:8-oxo-dGTP pyrophosphatase MutT (NUDIX family)
VLTAWEPTAEDQRDLRRDYLAFLEAHPDAMSRANRIGHLTGSALVVDAAREQVLLTLHPLVGRWLQLGGHVESSDPSLRDAARREAVEEGGIADVRVDDAPLRLDRHSVRCRDGRGGEDELHHLDVQFLALAPEGSIARISSESIDLRWWPWAALPPDTDDSVRALVAAARHRLGA